MTTEYVLQVYEDNNRKPFVEWCESLDEATQARIDKNIYQLKFGNFNSVKALREGIFELKMDFGPGYRVYFGREGKNLVILLGGGSKRRQAADIAAAVTRWRKFRQSKN